MGNGSPSRRLFVDDDFVGCLDVVLDAEGLPFVCQTEWIGSDLPVNVGPVVLGPGVSTLGVSAGVGGAQCDMGAANSATFSVGNRNRMMVLNATA